MRRPRQTLAAALLLPLLAGCGGAPQASAPPTPGDGSPTSTESNDDAGPPDRNPNVQRKNRAGAEAATRAFLDNLNYAAMTGDTTQLRTTYVPFCTRCEAIADGIDAVYERGGTIDGGAWIETSLRFYDIQRDIAYVDAVVDYTPQTWQSSETEAPRRVPAQTNVLKAFNLRFSDQAGWRVSALDPEQ